MRTMTRRVIASGSKTQGPRACQGKYLDWAESARIGSMEEAFVAFGDKYNTSNTEIL